MAEPRCVGRRRNSGLLPLDPTGAIEGARAASKWFVAALLFARLAE